MRRRLRDEAARIGAQAAHYRPEGEHPRDCADLPHRLSPCQDTLSGHGGLHARPPRGNLQPDEEQRLGCHHPLARAVRHDTAVARNPARHLAAGTGQRGGKLGSLAPVRQRGNQCPTQGRGKAQDELGSQAQGADARDRNPQG